MKVFHNDKWRIGIKVVHRGVAGANVREAHIATGQVGLDHLALGHWPSHAQYPSGDSGVRMARSGTNKNIKFDDRDSDLTGDEIIKSDDIKIGYLRSLTMIKANKIRRFHF